MIKGKLRVNWFSADELELLDETLPLDDFTTLGQFYDVCEEKMLEEGFELWDDEINYVDEVDTGRWIEIRYNCAIVRGKRMDGKFSVKEIGISYYHIKNSNMDDLARLSYAYDHLRPFTAGGREEQDGVKAKKYLKDIIDKMRKQNLKNIK